VSQDIDAALRGWEYKPGVVQARLVNAADGREVIQMRVDLGLLQLEITGRPDGARPNGSATMLDSLHKQARGRDDFVLGEEECAEADREFLQFYHRRLCWLALHRFDRAVADADHTLALMDFVRDHSPGDDYTQAHEQYRGFVLFHRTQAAAALAIEQDRPEAAVDAIRAGLEGIRTFYAGFEAEEQMEEDALVRRLREMERLLREKHNIDATLREQLDEAIAREDYERAAQLRDAMRRGE
jgi:hypothetical protein